MSPGSSQGRPCDRVLANEAGAGVCWEGLPFPKPGPPRARSLSHLHCGRLAALPFPGGRKRLGLAPPSCWVGQGKPCASGALGWRFPRVLFLDANPGSS